MLVLIEPGKLDLTFDSIVTVKGTKTNEAYTALRLRQNEMRKTLRGIVDQFDSETEAGTMTEERDAELSKSYHDLSDQVFALSVDFVKANVGNKMGEYVFLSASSSLKPEQKKEILALASDELKANENAKRIIMRLESMEKVAIGKKFVDFTSKDPEGNEVSLRLCRKREVCPDRFLGFLVWTLLLRDAKCGGGLPKIEVKRI